ncbi:MAG: PAS domain S-box protein, partial [bacterium]
MRTAEEYQRDAQVLRTSLHGVLEAAPDAIVLVDPNGRIALVNSQAERLFGYDHESLIGEMVEMLVPARFGHHAAHRGGYFTDPRTRTMGSALELAGIRKDATEF